jgi:beta-lactamase superfamily II metal-dependent hydrolase
MYCIEMMPAEYGDCLWVEYGNARSPNRILIDAGTPSVFERVKTKIEALPKEKRFFELLVITHIDEDHIGGAMLLLEQAKALGVRFNDIWFNGYIHLRQYKDKLGPVQGERLTRAIVDGKQPWNKAFNEQTVVVPVKGSLPTKQVGGMKITLLSPYPAQLAKLERVWRKVVRDEGLVERKAAKPKKARTSGLLGSKNVKTLAASKFSCDAAPANGSCIAFLAEYGGATCLFGADAYPTVLLQSIERIEGAGRLKFHAFKVPHHGSKNNLHVDLLENIDCDHFLVSTNGKKFSHPDAESIARVVTTGNGRTLHFNYRTSLNSEWDAPARKKQYGYSTRYPNSAEGGLVVDLE